MKKGYEIDHLHRRPGVIPRHIEVYNFTPSNKVSLYYGYDFPYTPDDYTSIFHIGTWKLKNKTL